MPINKLGSTWLLVINAIPKHWRTLLIVGLGVIHLRDEFCLHPLTYHLRFQSACLCCGCSREFRCGFRGGPFIFVLAPAVVICMCEWANFYSGACLMSYNTQPLCMHHYITYHVIRNVCMLTGTHVCVHGTYIRKHIYDEKHTWAWIAWGSPGIAASHLEKTRSCKVAYSSTGPRRRPCHRWGLPWTRPAGFLDCFLRHNKVKVCTYQSVACILRVLMSCVCSLATCTMPNTSWKLQSRHGVHVHVPVVRLKNNPGMRT